MHRVPISSLFAVVAAVASPSQQALTARSFLPDDHRNVVVVDFAALRAQGIWDELEGSALRAVLKRIEKEAGITLRALDRLTMVADPGDSADPGLVGRRKREVRVLEGNAALALPPSVSEHWHPEEIGAHKVRRGGRDLAVCPRPELYVEGSEDWVGPPLEGRPFRGTPAPDVMSLLAGRTEPLAHFVLDVTAPFLRERALEAVFPGTTWADGEAPTFVCVRLIATGDADDPHLTVEAIVRHAKEGAGAAVTEKAFAALRDRLVAMPQLRVVAPVLTTMTTRIDRTDTVGTLDLGRARNAIGHVAALGGLFLARAEGPVAVPAPVAPAPAPAPAPAGEKKN